MRAATHSFTAMLSMSTSWHGMPREELELLVGDDRREGLDAFVQVAMMLGDSEFNPEGFTKGLAQDGRLAPEYLHRAFGGFRTVDRQYWPAYAEQHRAGTSTRVPRRRRDLHRLWRRVRSAIGRVRRRTDHRDKSSG
jgi:hypothetical protein